MTEEPAKIPENTIEEGTNAENSLPQEEKTPENPAPSEPKKKGRPAGSKDRLPRRRIKVEPFPAPVETTPPRAISAPPKAPPAAQPVAAPATPPSPPSPRTLYRQASEHLINLRDIMNAQKRNSVAERYTRNLHSWMA